MTCKKRLLSCALSLLLSLCFSLIFYTFNTPLGPCIGSDNAIYLTMGTALAQGYAPYTEIFDHKGPLLFVLEAIPQALSGGYSTLAVFIMEVLFLFGCLRVLCAICRTLRAPCVPVQLAYLALTCSLVGCGNLTEEYTNLFTLLGLLLALRAFGGAPLRGCALTACAAGMGVMTMLSFLMRANNALPLCAVTLVLATALALGRDWPSLGRCALGFSLGLASVALPIAAWLAAQGALEEAVYGSIIHNMLYAGTDRTSRLAMLLYSDYGHMALLLAALTCAGAATLWGRRKALTPALIAAAAAAGLAAFISHKFYDHYLMLGVPAAALGVGAMLGHLSHAKRAGLRRALRPAVLAVMLVCALWMGINGVKANRQRLSERADWKNFAADAKALYAEVPEEDRDSFMAYRVEPRWYVASEALPCMRFYFLQEILAQADPAVMDEIVETFETNPPRWLVLYYNRAFSPPYDERVAEIFARDYEFVDAQGEYQLLRLKETP